MNSLLDGNMPIKFVVVRREEYNAETQPTRVLWLRPENQVAFKVYVGKETFDANPLGKTYLLKEVA